MSVLETDGVGILRGGRWLLADVSVGVEAGSLTVLAGPNGAGKSTLVSALAGDIRPDRGRVCFGGRDLARWRVDELARSRAVLRQQSPLAFDFTALEVVALGRAPWRDGSRADVAALAVLRTIGLEWAADRRYRTLSGGERQRVQVARVLAQLAGGNGGPPLAALFDEPVAALDPRYQHEVLSRARALADHGLAVVVVLHELSLAARYADRICLLREGRLVAWGPPADVLVSPVLEAAFEVPFRVFTVDGVAVPISTGVQEPVQVAP